MTLQRDPLALTAGLIKIQDQERRRIARELHDSVGQMLALLRMNQDRLAKLANLKPDAAEVLSENMALVETISAEIRTISYLLHPPLLDELGLVTALRALVDGFSHRSGIETILHIDNNLARLPCEMETSVYRIIQECLSNVHRHSGSTTATIRVERQSTEIRVEIQDHGKGISAEKTGADSGVGLTGMRERAAQLGGALQIESGKTGTTVIVQLPLPKESHTPRFAKSA